MNLKRAHLFSLVALTAGGLAMTSSAQAWPRCNNNYTYVATQPARPALTGYEPVYHPLYKLQSTTRRTEVPSGSRMTVYANYLGMEPGFALLNLDGTSTECNIIEWHNNSVTLDLPRRGLASPKDATLELVLPDGRIIKVFQLLLVSPPDIMVQGSATPLPMPPAPVPRSVTCVAPVQGGIVLQAAGY